MDEGLHLTTTEDGAHPAQVGLYVIYTNGPMTTRWAERKLMSWAGENWYHPLSDQRFRDHVYAFIGPLPALPLED